MSETQFFNRDISWLSFNGRVLAEAERETVPLLERVKFLSIYSSNLDEFYRVRIPAIRAIEKINKKKTFSIYPEVEKIINWQQNKFGEILHQSIISQLEKYNYYLLFDGVIPQTISAQINDYFFTQVAGFLQFVQLIDGSDFFPENNQLYLTVMLMEENQEEKIFLINIPTNQVSRFFQIEDDKKNYIVFLEDIIYHNLNHLFQDAAIIGAYNIKITRDAELNIRDDYDEDLADKIEKQLLKRDYGFATRLLYEPGISPDHLQQLIEILKLEKAVVVEGGRHHQLKDLASLPIQNKAISYPLWLALPALAGANTIQTLFNNIVIKDRLIHPPYQSYDTILRFFNEAAIDHTVEEIYATIYRVAGDSKIVQALITAAKNGKKVLVLVELKARFDEANNIRWAKKMKAGGVKIIYSQNSLKVHAKIALIKRKHPSHPLLGLLATGNMNESTARFYTDHILLTANQEMLLETDSLFTFLSKRKKVDVEENIAFKHLLVAQFNLQQKFIELIDREIQNAKIGLASSIILKLNNLEEEVMISKLYEASNAGVRIDIIVRGICRLIPGIPQQSEHIFITRIIDRYLEHGRIFIFHNNNDPQVFMGSADWMSRNIYRRIEVCFPVYDKTLKHEMIHLTNLQLQDNVQAVRIDHNQSNALIKDKNKPLRSQEEIYCYLKEQNQ